jgi:hypothetical protein
VSEKINLKELQRKAWRSMFQDGIWDIFLGLLLLNIAAFTLTDAFVSNDDTQIILYIGGELIALLLLWAGKRFITVPRMGKAKFGQFGKIRRSKVRLVLFVTVLMGLIVLLVFEGLSNNGQFAGLSRDYLAAGGWVLSAMLAFGLAGYFLDFNRLYLIGAMYALPFPLDILIREIWQTDQWVFYIYAIPALVILAVGLFHFFRFLKNYPAVREDA